MKQGPYEKYSLKSYFFKKKFVIKDKLILITGASSGIGRALAIELAAKGASLILLGRNKKELAITIKNCKERSKQSTDSGSQKKFFAYAIDLTKDSENLQFYDFLKQKKLVVDVLVLNAGTSMHAAIRDTNLKTFRKMYEFNFATAVGLCQHLLPQLTKRKSMVLAINSVQSIIGVPYHGAYVASKHALSGYLETLELEEPDIAVVEMKLGWVRDTNIRKRTLDGQSKLNKNRKDDKTYHRTSISLETCIERILYAMEHRKRYCYSPDFWKHILFVKYAFRWRLNTLITRRVSRDKTY